jgi:hypothetical protein
MSKLLVLVSALSLSTSGILFATKCDDAKSYLSSNRANLIPTFNLETSNQKVKLTQQAAIERLGLLDRAVERKHEFLCGYALEHLKEDVAYVEKNL